MSAYQDRLRGKPSHSTFGFVESLEARRLLSTVVVNTTADQTDALGSGTVSLRDAVNLANASGSTPTTITFDPTVFAATQTITLGGTQLELTNTGAQTTIEGPSAGVAINADGLSKVFTVDTNVIAAFELLTLRGASNPNGMGGGLENLGSADLSYCSIILNAARDGAGIYNYGTLHLLDSTVAYNNASIGNGGIGSTGTAILINDTIYGNQSPAGTGGYGDDGTATLDNVTITGNTGNDFVGGFFTGDGQTTISNSIIAGNSGESSGVVPDVFGTFQSDGHNLIGATDSSSGWIASDLTGTAANPFAAELGSFAYNGGPTETLAPLAYSPALSGGSVALIYTGITTDQRDQPRTVDGTVDIGAVEIGGQPTLQPTTTTLSSSARILTVGQSPLYVVTVKPTVVGVTPTGTVSIYEQGALQGSYALSDGEVTESLTPAQYSTGTDFTAVYSGDSRYASSTSSILQQDVQDKGQYVGTNPYRPISAPAAVAGTAFSVTEPFKITNSGPTMAGTFTLAFDINQSSIGLDANPATLETVKRHLTLKTGKSASVTLGTKKLPASLTPGTYYFVAQITGPDSSVDFVTVPTPIDVQAPVVTLTATATAVKPAVLTVKKPGTTVISIDDTGNIAAAGTLTITVLPSADGTSAASDTPLATFSHRVSIKPGKIAKYAIHLKIPASLVAGMYDPLATLSLDGVSAAVTGSPFTVADLPAR